MVGGGGSHEAGIHQRKSTGHKGRQKKMLTHQPQDQINVNNCKYKHSKLSFFHRNERNERNEELAWQS